MFLWLAGMLLCCQKPIDQGRYYDLIPSDSKAVVALKLKQLSEKAGIEDIWQNRHTALEGNKNAEMVRKLKEVFRNGEGTGLELSENVYLFHGKENSEVLGCVAKVNDVSQLKDVFRYMAKESVCTSLVSSGGFYETVVEGELFCQFNESFFLGLRTDSPEMSREYARTLIGQREKNSFADSRSFREMINSTDDISVLVVMEQIFRLASITPGNPFPGMDFLIGINFKEGNIQMRTKMLADDPAVLSSLEEENYLGKASSVFMDYYPSTALLYSGFHVIGERMNKMIERYGGWQIQEAAKTEIEKSLSAFNGEFTLGMTQLSALGIPSVLMYAEVNNTYPLESFVSYIRTQLGSVGELKKKGKNAYELTLTALPVYTFYFGIKDNHLLYFTNDNELYRNLAQKAKEPLSAAAWAGGLKRAAYGGAILNIGSFVQSPVLQLSLGQVLGSQQGRAVTEGLKEFTYAEILYPALTESVFNLYLKNKTQNSLKTLIQLGKQE